MGIFDFFRREKRSEINGAVTLEELLGGNIALTVKTAMQVPAVAYCVEMIAGAAAMLPVKLYVKKSDGEIEEIDGDSRVKFLNSDTGDTINADNMRRVWVRDFLLTGSAFAYIESCYGKPSKLKYIPSSAVSVMKDDIDYINKRFSYMVNGAEILPYRMLKILRNSDGFGRGRGIVEESPLILETMYQLLKFQKNQVLKGGNKRGFLKTDGTVRPEVQENIKNNWRKINSNDDTEKVMFLNGNVDFKEMSSTSVEMQLNENVKTNDLEIMRLFGTVDGILSPDTLKNAVMPVLDAFEAAFDADLLLESEKKDHYFAFDTKELTRGSVSERYSAYAVALQNNFMQLDEVRALEDLPPLGFNYITLGLQNVLVNPATGEVYTPNTNATANMNRLGNVSGTDNDSTEERAWVTINGHHVYFDKDGQGGGSAGNSQKGVDKVENSGIIKSTDNAKGTVLFDKIPQNLIDYAVKVENAENLTYNEKNRLFHNQALQITSMLKGSVITARGDLVAVSDHATRRMCERNITPKEVKEVLKKYDISYPSKDDSHAAMLKSGDIILSVSDTCVLKTAIRDDTT